MKKGMLIILIIMLAAVSLSSAATAPYVGGTIAFTSDRSGTTGIWAMDLSTGATREVIDSTAGKWTYVDQPRWSIDGKLIFFAAYSGNWNIYMINSDGTGLKQLTSYSDKYYAYNPVASPLYPYVVFYTKVCQAYSSTVHRLNVLTGEDIEIPNSSGMTTQYFDVMNDEKGIIFSREPGCCWTPTMYSGYQDMKGSYEKILLPTDGNAEWVGRISRKTGSIAYHEATAYYAPVNIFMMNQDGTNRTQLTFGTGSDSFYYPVWTGVYGEYILFSGERERQPGEIYLMKPDKSSYPDYLINLTDHPANDRDADWTKYSFVMKEPAIKVSTASYDFGNIELGRPSTMFLTVANAGGGELVISDMSWKYLIDPFTFTLPSALPISIPAGKSIDVEVTYSPSWLYWAQSNTLLITSNDPAAKTMDVSFSGTGVVAGEPSEAVGTVLKYIDLLATNGSIVPEGSGSSAEKRYNALKNMIRSAGDLLSEGNTAEGCEQLLSIYQKVDGSPNPPDFIIGTGTSTISSALAGIMTQAGCN